ncbi:hypothetical protein JR316_0002418 [Psilocybe cubensis]|uniref:Uncharacterized protein n=2 Tax=Psilocybe cubensis TaxID=181762 RepID=A0ACB8HEE1_PSICU|nr:hypothetical protein JR316_0002418 [Psilocybe cubensis]KAH9485510.1 hypothetical protein JR316_0002418 [Psilocybe cubensis]
MSGFVSTGDPLIDALLAAGLIGPFVTYSDVSASTVFLYDYLLTLSMEIDLIWRSPWNVIKIIFIIQRYLPFIDTCFLTIYRQLGKLTIAQCEILPYFNGFMYMFGLALSEILLSIRVWAIWDRNMKLAYFQAVLFVIIWSPAFYAMYAYVSSLRYANPPANLLDYRGCFIVDAKEYVLWSWVGVLLWNTVTLTFTLIHSFRSYRAGLVSGLAAVIYRDGAYFYVYLFIFSALNIVFTTTLQARI